MRSFIYSGSSSYKYGVGRRQALILKSRLSNAGDTEGNPESSGPPWEDNFLFFFFLVSAEVTRYSASPFSRRGVGVGIEILRFSEANAYPRESDQWKKMQYLGKYGSNFDLSF